MVRLLQLCIGMFMLQNPSPAKKIFYSGLQSEHTRTAVRILKDSSPNTEGLA